MWFCMGESSSRIRIAIEKHNNLAVESVQDDEANE